jgi:hypothetical protein
MENHAMRAFEDVEANIWTKEGRSDSGLEKIAQ